MKQPVSYYASGRWKCDLIQSAFDIKSGKLRINRTDTLSIGIASSRKQWAEVGCPMLEPADDSWVTAACFSRIDGFEPIHPWNVYFITTKQSAGVPWRDEIVIGLFVLGMGELSKEAVVFAPVTIDKLGQVGQQWGGMIPIGKDKRDYFSDSGWKSYVADLETANGMAEGQYRAEMPDDIMSHEWRRNIEMIANLITSCCAETMRLRECNQFTRAKRKEFRTPRSFMFEKTYVIGRPIDIDREIHIGDYVAGNGIKLNTQHVVRGHFKRQPYGEGRSESRIIHIAPYPRGPKDAPFAVRPHRI